MEAGGGRQDVDSHKDCARSDTGQSERTIRGPLPSTRSRMEPVDTLVSARWVVPVEPDGRVLEDHSVAIRGGRIVAVLPTAEAPRAIRRARSPRPAGPRAAARARQRPHARGDGAAARPRREPAARARGCATAVWPLERRWIDPEYVRDGTELAIAEMLRGGITCFADMHLWPEVVAQTAAELRTCAPASGSSVTEAATSWAATADEYIDRGMRLRDEYKGDPLVSDALRAARAPLRVRRNAGAGAPAGRRARHAGRDAPARDRAGRSSRACSSTASVRSRGSPASGSRARSWSRST